MSNKEEANLKTVQAVDRSLDLIDALSTIGKSCSIKTLSTMTGLHKATVHRLLQTLMQHHYVKQDDVTGNYSLGYKFLSISAKMINNLDIHNVARPYLQAICDATGQAVNLSVLQGKDAIFIDKVENPNQVIRMYSQVGKSIPVYCSASGKVLIAWQNETKLLDTVNSIEFQRFTNTTITDRGTLLQVLSEVRQKGYATDWFEHEETIFCVAVPVFNYSGEVIASISIAGAMLLQTKEKVICHIAEANEKAAALSRELGCIAPLPAFNPKYAEKDAETLFSIAEARK